MPDVSNIETHRANAPTPDGFTAFLALAELWRLSTDQQITLLGAPARSTYFKWKKDGGSMSPDTAGARLSPHGHLQGASDPFSHPREGRRVARPSPSLLRQSLRPGRDA